MKMNRWFTHCETGFWQTRNDIHYINNDMDDCGGSLQKIPSFATTSQSGVPYQFPNHLRWSGRPSITATKNGKVNKTYQEKQEVRKIQNSNINKLLLCCLIWILLNLDVHLLTMAIWRHFGSYSQASGKPTIRRLDPRPSPNKGKSVRHVIGKYAIF